MSAACSEAFMHELIYLLRNCYFDESLKQAGEVLHKSEEDKTKSLINKYQDILKELEIKKSQIKDFESLISLRNKIVHLDYIDRLAATSDKSATAMILPEVVKKLRARRLLKVAKKTHWVGWFEFIQSQKLAWWSCKTVRDLIVQILQTLPEDFADYFEIWRPFSAMDLPPIPLERTVKKSKLKDVYYRGALNDGHIAYLITPNKKVIFSAIKRDATSTTNAMSDVLGALFRQEKLNSKFEFYDLWTHLGYGGFKSGEYQLNQIYILPKKIIKFGETVEEVRILRRKARMLIRSKDYKLRKSISHFNKFIGRLPSF
jgi:hypothetical protein